MATRSRFSCFSFVSEGFGGGGFVLVAFGCAVVNFFSLGCVMGSGEGDCDRLGDPRAVGKDVGWVFWIEVGCWSLSKEMAVFGGFVRMCGR